MQVYEASMSAAHPSRHRLQGQPTRGKTTHNRLRRVDIFLLLYDDTLLRRTYGNFARAYYVDLGFGAEPFTTLESAARLRQVNPRLPVLGVEIDPARVAAALAYADDVTHFRLGGFNVPLETGEFVRVIRAFNVLRQYNEDRVIAAWQTMGRCLLPSGLLIEGTSDPFGQVWVANLLRRAGDTLRYEGLLFSTNFRQGFTPELFQPVLPKNLIHRIIPGEPIHEFMSAWKSAVQETTAHQSWGLRQWFVASAEALAAREYTLSLRRKLLKRGYLLWQDNPDEICIQL